jgi:hypothetical protein
MYAVIAAFWLVLILRWLWARRATPRKQERQQKVAALCEKRGLSPGLVNLTNYFEIASPMGPSAFENSFSSLDGGISAADFWRHEDNKNWYAFSLLAITLAGLNMPYVAVTRKGLPGLALVWGPPHVGLESIDFDTKFTVRAQDRRSAVMLLDQGMMQWLLDCEQVSFEIGGNRVAALVRRSAEPTYQPALPSHSNPRRADPVELELLFKFMDGFVPRIPLLLRSEYAPAQIISGR